MVTRRHFPWMLAVCAASLSLLSACVESVAPPVEETFHADDYLWSAAREPARFCRETAGMKEIHELEFSEEQIVDTRLDTLGNRLGSVVLTRLREDGRDVLLGTSDHTLLSLPRPMRFQPRVYTVPGPRVTAQCWMNFADDLMLIAGETGTLYRYRPSSDVWEHIAVPWTGAVAAMTRDLRASGQLLAATVAEGLYLLRADDSTWTRLNAPDGRITDMVSDDNGALFVVIDERMYFRQPENQRWIPFPLSSVYADVTQIDLIDFGGGNAMLFVGRKDGALAQVRLKSSWPVQITMMGPPAMESIVHMQASAGSPYAAVAVAYPPVLYGTPENSGLWASIPLPVDIQPTAVCQSAVSGDVIVGTGDGLYRFDGAPVRRSGLEGQQIRSLHFGKDNAFYCGTAEGTFRSRDGGITWSRVDATPQLREAESGMTLLPASFGVGSSWAAAILSTGVAAGVMLRGRIVEHFDHMLFPGDRGTYQDVLIVRYAQEDALGDPRPGSYFWTIYYARDRGPVYIEEAVDNRIVARAWQLRP